MSLHWPVPPAYVEKDFWLKRGSLPCVVVISSRGACTLRFAWSLLGIDVHWSNEGMVVQRNE